MRKSLKIKLFLNILGATIFSSCSLKEIKQEAPQINNILLNDKYKINLPEDHSSGYLWRLSENYDDKIIERQNTVWHGNAKGVDFNFNTLTVGQTTLTFISRKYTDTSDIKHFIVNITPK